MSETQAGAEERQAELDRTARRLGLMALVGALLAIGARLAGIEVWPYALIGIGLLIGLVPTEHIPGATWKVLVALLLLALPGLFILFALRGGVLILWLVAASVAIFLTHGYAAGWLIRRWLRAGRSIGRLLSDGTAVLVALLVLVVFPAIYLLATLEFTRNPP